MYTNKNPVNILRRISGEYSILLHILIYITLVLRINVNFGETVYKISFTYYVSFSLLVFVMFCLSFIYAFPIFGTKNNNDIYYLKDYQQISLVLICGANIVIGITLFIHYIYRLRRVYIINRKLSIFEEQNRQFKHTDNSAFTNITTPNHILHESLTGSSRNMDELFPPNSSKKENHNKGPSNSSKLDQHSPLLIPKVTTPDPNDINNTNDRNESLTLPSNERRSSQHTIMHKYQPSNNTSIQMSPDLSSDFIRNILQQTLLTCIIVLISQIELVYISILFWKNTTLTDNQCCFLYIFKHIIHISIIICLYLSFDINAKKYIFCCSLCNKICWICILRKFIKKDKSRTNM